MGDIFILMQMNIKSIQWIIYSNYIYFLVYNVDYRFKKKRGMLTGSTLIIIILMNKLWQYKTKLYKIRIVIPVKIHLSLIK